MAHDDVISCQGHTAMDTELVDKFRKAHTSFSRGVSQQTSPAAARPSSVRQQHTPRRTGPSVKPATRRDRVSAADVWEVEARQASQRLEYGRLSPPPNFEGWDTSSKVPTAHLPQVNTRARSPARVETDHVVQQRNPTAAVPTPKGKQQGQGSSNKPAAAEKPPAERTVAWERSRSSTAGRADNHSLPASSRNARVREQEACTTTQTVPVSPQPRIRAKSNVQSCKRDQTSSKPLHASVLRVKGSSPPSKMTPSSDDDHDEVMLKDRNPTRDQGGNQPANGPQVTPQRESPHLHDGDSMQCSSRGNVRRVGPRRNNVSAVQNSNNSPQATTTTDTAGCKVAPPDVQDELEKYRRDIVRHAHLNRFGAADLPAGNAEALEKVRKGPALDPSSEDYKLVASFRAIPVAHPYEYPRGFVTNRYDRDHKEECAVYAATSRVYPRVVNGHIELSTVPQAGQETQPAATRHRSKQEYQAAQPSPPGGEVPSENRWATSYYADWQWRPQSVSNYEAFRDTFRSWLNESMALPCLADIYHESFVNGVAHPDGVQGFLLPDLEDYPTSPDPNDEETRLHREESATAYGMNFLHHEGQQRQAQVARSGYARASYLSSSAPLSPSTLPSPRGPKSPLANVYLRPAEVGDIPELMDLFNWYIRNADLSVHADLLDAGDIRQCLDNCRQQNLPFIVAAERRFGTGAHPVETPEKIYGYALARDSSGAKTTGRFTAELELFVRAEEIRKGIGRCLMDKLLEVCDATYNAKQGYFFDSNLDERTAYTPGGRRKLARIMFILAFSDGDTSHYQWVKNWLKNHFGFEEQGVLRGARVKSDRFLDTSYLVREVGHSSGRSFKNC